MPHAARAAKNENLFREVNEQILQLEEGFGGETLAGFVCECSRLGCMSKLEATLAEYREVREVATHFIVARGHVDPDHERIVSSTDRYSVVEKFGLAGQVAESEARSPSAPD
jgi:hypothetical protein